ncbi:hypothetical protein ACFFGV_17830 [Pontibacillus salicampi]|uniref:Plastocyanin-like domain-containing protein n=1 Tax=Pontibacillus salicampi TaxID=1449801 RepID=A0ABV6LSQ6_9BACI
MSGGISGNGEADTEAMYDTLSNNGKNGNQIKNVEPQQGEKARFRFINAGYQTQFVNFPNQSMRIISVDGKDNNNSPSPSKSMIEIALVERMDVEFTRTNKSPQSVTLLNYNESASLLSIPVREKSVDNKKI